MSDYPNVHPSDHFGLWAWSLALTDGYRDAYKVHSRYADELGRGNPVAVRWAVEGRKWLEAERARYDETGGVA